MYVKDVKHTIEITAPTLSFFISGTASILFLIAMIPAFLIGTIWAGIRQGFIIGREW